MRRDKRHLFVALTLVAMVLTAGCIGVLSTAESEDTPSGRVDDSTPAPAPGTTAGPVSEAPREQPRETSPSPTSMPTQTPAPSPAPTNASASTPTTPTTPTVTPAKGTPTPEPTQAAPVPAPAPAPAPSSGGASSSSSSSTTSTPVSTETTTTPSTTASADSSGSLDSSTETTVEVLRVLDGDTIRVAYPDGSTGFVNLAGVDAPDLYGGVDTAAFAGVPDTTGGQTYLYAWGWTAKRALQETLTDASVRIDVVDTVTPSIDDYASTAADDSVVVAYVSADTQEADDVAVNRLLLRDGLARTTDTDHPRRSTFLETMRAAQNEFRGLWDTDTDLSTP